MWPVHYEDQFCQVPLVVYIVGLQCSFKCLLVWNLFLKFQYIIILDADYAYMIIIGDSFICLICWVFIEPTWCHKNKSDFSSCCCHRKTSGASLCITSISVTSWHLGMKELLLRFHNLVWLSFLTWKNPWQDSKP